jgi:hypothetical protein
VKTSFFRGTLKGDCGPDKANKKWSPEEDERLKSLIEANTSIHLIAAKLKRPLRGVKTEPES